MNTEIDRAMEQDNWETQTVIDCLINDEYCYKETLNKAAHLIKRFVLEERQAPQGLYDSFNQPPKSSFEDVDWYAVEAACEE